MAYAVSLLTTSVQLTDKGNSSDKLNRYASSH